MTRRRALAALSLGLIACAAWYLASDPEAPVAEPPRANDEEQPVARSAPLPPVSVRKTFPTLRFKTPVQIAHAHDGTDRLYVATVFGAIYTFSENAAKPRKQLFLDLRDRVRFGGDSGFMDFVFHPRYRENGRLFVYYCALENNRIVSIVSEFKSDPKDRLKVPKDSEKILLRIPQPHLDHKAGCLRFGPDGYLYFSIGDGGINQRSQPTFHAQDTNSLLGTVLRLDVDAKGTAPYAIPADNPFVGDPKVRDEIWAYGLRAPWRFCFDPFTDLCWLGDNGQWSFEEVNIIRPGGNYGWPHFEGLSPYDPDTSGPSKRRGPPPGPKVRLGPAPGTGAKFTGPVLEVRHKPSGGSQSIIGGVIYHGTEMLELIGAYLYADWVTGEVFALRWNGERVTAHGKIAGGVPQPTSFGYGPSGALYLVCGDGFVYRIAPPDPSGLSAPDRVLSPGGALFHERCIACHKLDGSASVGPALNGFFKKGSTLLANGRRVEIDRDYFVDSIRKPHKHVVKGYSNLMPPVSASDLTDKDLEELQAFLEDQ